MRYFLHMLCLIFVLISCNNHQDREEKEKNQQSAQREKTRENLEDNTAVSDTSKNRDIRTQPGSPKKNNSPSQAISTRTTYVKVDKDDADCNCYCLELDMRNETELCLQENKIYINARYSKEGNKINMFYKSPSTRNTDEELPWKDFDSTTPIAVLTPSENGKITLDWKGFSIDGELAVDFAIYGKKTLEGTYKKQ